MKRIEEIEKMFDEMKIDYKGNSSLNVGFSKLKNQPSEQTFYLIQNFTQQNKEEQNAELARYQRRIENCR